jgi:hypothetical protein
MRYSKHKDNPSPVIQSGSHENFRLGNKPAMDKLFYFVRRTNEAIELSVEYLNDLDVFPRVMPHNRPFNILLEGELDEVLEHKDEKSDDNDDDIDDYDSDKFEGVYALVDSALKLWKEGAKILKSDFAICGRYLCVLYQVMSYVRDNGMSERREAVERVTEGLYYGL